MENIIVSLVSIGLWLAGSNPDHNSVMKVPVKLNKGHTKVKFLIRMQKHNQ